MKVTAHATRSQGWWVVEVPEVDGAFTQARRLDQVPAMVRDAVSMLEDVPEESIEVEVIPEVDEELATALGHVEDQRAESDRLARAASEEIGAIAKAFSEKGLPLRDIGVILGMSHQRVAQIIGATAGALASQRPGGKSLARAQEAAVRKQVSALKGGGRSLSRSARDGTFVREVAARSRSTTP